jgi:hypothetical protein
MAHAGTAGIRIENVFVRQTDAGQRTISRLVMQGLHYAMQLAFHAIQSRALRRNCLKTGNLPLAQSSLQSGEGGGQFSHGTAR